MARYDDLNTSMIGYAAIFSSILLIAIILGVQALCYSWEQEEEVRKLSSSEYATSLDVQREQLQSISGYQWVDVPAIEAIPPDQKAIPATKRLQIPIERAIELVIKERAVSKAGEHTAKPAPSGA